jgi:NADPH:quinone reductase-like Zn-dependent oxidoreductase
VSDRVVRFHRTGGSEVLDVEIEENRAPGPGEVSIAIAAAGVNTADLAYIAGTYGVAPALPAVPGMEAVGRVSKTGDGVAAGRIGERVLLALGAAGSQGTWRDDVIVDADHVFPISDRLTDVQAAAALIPYLTADVCVNRLASRARGKVLIVTAAGSAVGIAAGQVARSLGLRTVGTVRRKPNTEQSVSLSCDEIVVFDPAKDGTRLPNIDRESAGAVLDCVAGEVGAAAFRTMSSGGYQIVIGSLAGKTLPIDANGLIFGEKRLEGFWLNRWLARAGEDDRLQAYLRVLEGLESGDYIPAVDGEFELADVRLAVDRARTSGKRGKVVLRVGGA